MTNSRRHRLHGKRSSKVTPEDERTDQSAQPALIQTHGATAPEPINPLPLAAVLATFAIGVVLIYLQYWRRGSFLLGAACLLAALFRLLLPTHTAGLLVVRSKTFDVALAGLLGGALMVLALVVPGTFN